MNNIGTWEQPKHEKTPRPILGVGARLKQNEESNWRDRDKDSCDNQFSNWDSNKKKGGNWGNKHKKDVPKGWEHDDRVN